MQSKLGHEVISKKRKAMCYDLQNYETQTSKCQNVTR